MNTPVETTTDGVLVRVVSRYIPERSAPLRSHWFFAYTIRIENVGADPVRLLRRHWIITNAEGEVREVEGEGVVGETPRLMPGEHFEYTSACPLDTPFGWMHGTYSMVRDDDEAFDAEVPRFGLQQPHAIN